MPSLALFLGGSPGWGELLLVLLCILVLFGAKRLPDLARALGRSLSEFKKGKAEGTQASDAHDLKSSTEVKTVDKGAGDSEAGSEQKDA